MTHATHVWDLSDHSCSWTRRLLSPQSLWSSLVFFNGCCLAILWNCPKDAIYAHSLFLKAESWTLTWTEAGEACSALDVPGCSLSSLISCWSDVENCFIRGGSWGGSPLLQGFLLFVSHFFLIMRAGFGMSWAYFDLLHAERNFC